MKVAILSYWHVHAKDYAKQAAEHPETEIAALWDEDKSRGEQEASRLGVPFYDSLEAVLSKPEIEGVIVVTPTSMHRDVMVAAARAGKHIFTEKVIAPTLGQVNEILAAVKEAGVKLTVSLPRLNFGSTHAIQKILAQDLLGPLTLVRVRLSHNGATTGWLPERFFGLAESGGGALIDLGCHPMYLTRLFLGMPDTVSAHYGYVTGKEVEDNAVAVLGYANGALGIVEAGFVNDASPFSIEVHGTEGTLLFGTPEPKLLLRTSRLGEAAAKEWREQELPPDTEAAFAQWVKHIKEGTSADQNIQMAVDLTKLMEAANLSAQRIRPVRLDELQEN